MKAKLLGENRLKGMLTVRTIEELTELLEESAYKDEVVELSTKYHGVELVNRAVDLNFNRTIEKLARFLPQNGSDALFNLVLEEWTINNLKAIIASKATGIPLNPLNLVRFNNEQQALGQIAGDASFDLERTVRRLARINAGYSVAFQKIEREYFTKEPTADFRVMFKELDEYYYNKLGAAADREKEPAVKALLLAKVDFTNTMIVARLKLAGVGIDEIKDNIIKHPRRNKWAMNLLAEMETTLEVVGEIVKTHKLAPEIIEEFKNTNSLVKLEVELERRLVQKALVTSKVSVLSFAVILAFIFLKQAESTFLKAIAYSTQAGIRDEVKALVFSVKKT